MLARVGAIPEMLGEDTDSPCGLLISSRSVEDLRSAILEMIENPDKATELGVRAKKKQRSVTLLT